MRSYLPHFALVSLALALLWPSAGMAQFEADNPASVGVVILPFTLEYAEDSGLAARLEKVLSARLRARIGRPVFGAVDVLPAIDAGVAKCLADSHCISFMGDQFNVSLVLHVSMRKTGEELTLAVDFYATGNGLRLATERVTLAEGDEGALLTAFAGWITEFFDASLLINAESLAGQGGIIGRSDEEENRLADELERSHRKELSSRRDDFVAQRDDLDSTSETEVGFDRSDPTAALRSVAEGADSSSRARSRSRSAERASPPRNQPRQQSRQDERARPTQDDIDLDDLDEDMQPSPRKRRKGRKAARQRKSSISLDHSKTSGRSVRSYSEAQRAGLGVREYKRFTRSGLTMDAFLDRRWAHGRRFHVRAGGYYGLGWLTRRYATIIYIPATGQKTEEYGWESLGFSALNPGFSLGLGYAPLDFLEVELDVSFMVAQQDLRNEYIWQGADVPTNRGQPPRNQRTTHVLVDLRARFFVNPLSRVKFSPGIGLTVAMMGGYQIEDEGPLVYSQRPVAGVIGLTPMVGMTAALSPFLSLYVDLLPTIILNRGAAKYEDLLLYNGETERVGLQESDLNPPLIGCGGSQGEGFSSCPLLFRVAVGTMIMF